MTSHNAREPVEAIPGEQVRSAFQRWQNLEEEKARVADDLKELFAEQKALGHDTKAMRAAFRLKVKLDEASPADAEHEALVDTYLAALEAPRATRAYARENIEQSDVSPRLIKQVVDGMQTEAGRAALLTAVDIMIEREEAEENSPETATRPGQDVQSPSQRAMAGENLDVTGGESAATHLPETANETMGGTGDDCSFGNRGVWPPQGGASSTRELDDISSEQVVTAGETATISEKTPSSASHAANAGGDDVDRNAERVPTSNTGEGTAHSALPAKPQSRLRPNCLEPTMCRSGTRDHCYSCRKAMEREDAA